MKKKILPILIIISILSVICSTSVYAAKVGDEVIVGGMPFGIKFYTEGVLVCGVSEVDTDSGNISPGETAGIKKGDIIISIDERQVDRAIDVTEMTKASTGKVMKLKILRCNREISVNIKPCKSLSENEFKLGLWIKDGTAGIGTVTYIEKGNGTFTGLGHGVCDIETSQLLKLRKADVCDVSLSSVKQGRPDEPGALIGILSEKNIGYLTNNTEHGVYGVFETNTPTNTQEAVIADKNELAEGTAYILCTLDDNTINRYDIEIEKIFNNSEKSKNFVIRVTDNDLISKTGGIVQGMSGSPIIQNGKLVGAVTHVLVDDPTRGYGIFIENMLEIAG